MIRFDHVTKAYSGTSHPALNDVDIEIQSGEFVFLVGASGSGKSSFLRLVLKEERPTRGNVHVLGQHLNTLASRKVPFFRRKLGVVFQDFRLLPGKTVFENVAFTLQVIGKSSGFIQEAVPDVLKMVGLGGKQGRYPHELSGGEQQRVAIARAVVNKPAILLADEPTGNLDPATSAGIMQLLSTINANGTTVLMATHDVGIVNQMRRRVIELVSGQVVRDERSGGYQTQAVPIQTPAPVASPPVSTAPVSTPPAQAPALGIATPVDAPAAPPPTASFHLPPAFAPDPDEIDDRTVPRLHVTEAAAQAKRSERPPAAPQPAAQQQMPEVPPELNEPPARDGKAGR